MKSLLSFLLFFLIISGVSAQERSTYQPRNAQYSSYTNQEDFKVNFEKSAYGLTFQTNDSALDDDLKQKISQFMSNNQDRKEYQGNGGFILRIVKRNDRYYVVYQESPEKLLSL